MACYHPLRAWRLGSGAVALREPRAGGRFLQLPCGACIGCRTERAKGWSYRCLRELDYHDAASFVTLTYEYAPPQLIKDDLSAYIKRVRERVRQADSSRIGTKFFGSGEYGDRFGRPHYHVLWFGLHPQADKEVLTDAWKFGLVDVDTVTSKVVSYVAGYCSKKLGPSFYRGREVVDAETGEICIAQPPFIHMSRRPGIGATARDQFPRAWRDCVVVGGAKARVPRYLHEKWKRTATVEERDALEQERVSSWRYRSRQELDAGEANALARHKLNEQRRVRHG